MMGGGLSCVRRPGSAHVPTIEFLESALGPAVIAEGEGPLVDVCDDAGAPVGFSCRSANCATCRVEVLAGCEWLAPARDDERELLLRLAAPSQHRLACQVEVRPGRGLVRLRWVQEPGEEPREEPGERRTA